MNGEDSKYKLSERIHKEVFEEIKEDFLKEKSPVEDPVVIIIGGQPGAGKTVLVNLVDEEFECPVKIDVDIIREYHPEVQEIYKDCGENFAEHTSPDADKWAKELFDYSVENKYNTSLEMSLRTTSICGTLKELKEKGCPTHIKVIAVSDLISKYRIINRYNDEVEKGRFARLVPQGFHDESYSGMLVTVDKIEREGLFNTLKVYSKDSKGKAIYENNGRNKEPGAVKAIVEERNREWTKEQIDEYIDTVNTLIEAMNRRQENPEIIGQAKKLIESVRNRYNKERKDRK